MKDILQNILLNAFSPPDIEILVLKDLQWQVAITNKNLAPVQFLWENRKKTPVTTPRRYLPARLHLRGQVLPVPEAGGRGHPQPQHQPAARVSSQDQLVELAIRWNNTILLGLYWFNSTTILWQGPAWLWRRWSRLSMLRAWTDCRAPTSHWR